MNKDRCVYVLTNDSFPHLVKIGMTTRGAQLRARELDNTGLPHKYVVALEVPCFDPRAVEREVHRRLRVFRESGGKEFFRVSTEDAEAVVKAVANAMNSADSANRSRSERTMGGSTNTDAPDARTDDANAAAVRRSRLAELRSRREAIETDLYELAPMIAQLCEQKDRVTSREERSLFWTVAFQVSLVASVLAGPARTITRWDNPVWGVLLLLFGMFAVGKLIHLRAAKERERDVQELLAEYLELERSDVMQSALRARKRLMDERRAIDSEIGLLGSR